MGLFDFLRSEKRGDNFLKAVFGGYGAANRTAVTRDTSLTFSAVFACVRVISESIASLPIKVYSTTLFILDVFIQPFCETTSLSHKKLKIRGRLLDFFKIWTSTSYVWRTSKFVV